MKVFGKVTGTVVGLVLLAVGIWAATTEAGTSVFSTEFLPHRFCYSLQPALIWTNAVSDGLIWLAYVGIAVGLMVLLWKSQQFLPFHWVFVAFGIFIVACGFTHFFEAVTLWTPVYWLSTSVKVLTALASVATAIAFAPLVPRAAAAVRLFHEAYSTSERERVETLSQLLDTQERMKVAFESAGLGTWEYVPTRDEVYWDERSRVLFGVSDHQQLRYENFIERVHPDDRASVQSMVSRALADTHEYHAAFRTVVGDGETRHIIAAGKPLYHQGRQPMRMFGVVLDVTRQRDSEEALVKAEKLAVAGRMAAAIAHEVNNPLDAALGQLYLMRSDCDVPERIRARLELVEDELKRAGQITRSTLTFYRESPKPARTNLVDLAESVLAFQEAKIQKASLEVDKELVPSAPMDAFPGELRQIFTNLITNAVEAMDSGGKLFVRVRPAREWRSGREGYRIVIGDSGPGIPPEARKKLFNAFYTTKGEKGTGLGLWITSQLVSKNGGLIQFRSRCASHGGKSGTVFTVWLPLNQDVALQPAASA